MLIPFYLWPDAAAYADVVSTFITLSTSAPASACQHQVTEAMCRCAHVNGGSNTFQLVFSSLHNAQRRCAPFTEPSRVRV